MAGVHMIDFWVITSCRLRSLFLHSSEILEETDLTWLSDIENLCISHFHQKVQGMGHLINKCKVNSLNIAQEWDPLQISGPNMAVRDRVIRDSTISVRGTGGSVSKRNTVSEDAGRRTCYGT